MYKAIALVIAMSLAGTGDGYARHYKYRNTRNNIHGSYPGHSNQLWKVRPPLPYLYASGSAILDAFTGRMDYPYDRSCNGSTWAGNTAYGPRD